MAFQTKWSRDVKRGVLAAVFEREWSRKRAHAAAVAGDLPQLEPGEPRPLPAPGLPFSTVGDWCRHESARRAKVATAAAAPDVVMAGTLSELIAIHQRAVKRAAGKAARGTLGGDELSKLARAGVELVRFSRAVNTKGANGESEPVPTGAPAVNTNTAPGFLEGLAAAPDSGSGA
jgi:hypothetical protein